MELIVTYSEKELKTISFYTDDIDSDWPFWLNNPLSNFIKLNRFSRDILKTKNKRNIEVKWSWNS